MFDRLERRIVDGERNGLDDDLNEAMTTVPPLKIINETLLSGMKTVGELFGSGQMQLPFVLASAEAVLRRVLPPATLNRHCELVISGEEIDREELISSLSRAGYQLCDMVRQVGDMALRGGIIDVFPPMLDADAAGPLRLDFFGDLVESIRLFDPISQR